MCSFTFLNDQYILYIEVHYLFVSLLSLFINLRSLINKSINFFKKVNFLKVNC